MKDYYIPPTVNELIKGLQNLIKDPKCKVSGDENIVDAFLVTDSDEDVPPCSIGFTIRRGNAKGDDKEIEFGTICIPPSRPRKFM